MEWSSIDWNSTIPEVFEALLDKWSDQSGQLSKFLFDNCVLPVGQYLLSSAERAVQYTLNGEYEVTRGELQMSQINFPPLLRLLSGQVWSLVSALC